MTIFFNIENIELETSYNPYKTLQLLENLTNNSIVSTKLKRLVTGTSFLLNPEPLFTGNTDILHKIQYIKLAAKRDYAMYKLYNYRGLNLTYFPDINLKAIQNNKLLEIADNQINFAYEG